ncbi:3H domain-containing protein [Enterococcus sp. LJL98]
MLDGEQRRKEILARLQKTKQAVSATKFAKEFGVSRQVIVGDVALLRAAGEEILATARGYQLNAKEMASGFLAKIAVQHEESLTKIELETILAFGGEVIDVVVEHELYGELVGGLHIASQADVERFMQKYQHANARLLSQLTNGIHLHTIRYQKAGDLSKIKAALAEKGILYQG